MINAERKDGIIKQLDVDNSNLNDNNVEDLSTDNSQLPDNDGIVITRGYPSIQGGVYIPRKNLKLEAVKDILTQLSSITPLEQVTSTGTPDVLVPILVNKVNEIIDVINNQIDFAINELDQL